MAKWQTKIITLKSCNVKLHWSMKQPSCTQFFKASLIQTMCFSVHSFYSSSITMNSRAEFQPPLYITHFYVDPGGKNVQCSPGNMTVIIFYLPKS